MIATARAITNLALVPQPMSLTVRLLVLPTLIIGLSAQVGAPHQAQIDHQPQIDRGQFTEMSIAGLKRNINRILLL